MISLTKSCYHSADVNSASIVVNHYCRLLNAHRLEPPRAQGRPFNTSNFMSRENDPPITVSGYRALTRNMIADSRTWHEFQFEQVLVDIDVTEAVGVIVKGRLANNTTRRTNTGVSYVCAARVLAGIAGVIFGGPAFRDIELSQDIFVSQ